MKKIIYVSIFIFIVQVVSGFNYPHSFSAFRASGSILKGSVASPASLDLYLEEDHSTIAIETTINELESIYRDSVKSSSPFKNEDSIWKTLYTSLDLKSTTLDRLTFNTIKGSQQPLIVKQIFQRIKDGLGTYDNWTIAQIQGTSIYFLVNVRGTYESNTDNATGNHFNIHFYSVNIVPLPTNPKEDDIIDIMNQSSTTSPSSESLWKLGQALELKFVSDQLNEPKELNVVAGTEVSFLSPDGNSRIMRGSQGGLYLLRKIKNM